MSTQTQLHHSDGVMSKYKYRSEKDMTTDDQDEMGKRNKPSQTGKMERDGRMSTSYPQSNEGWASMDLQGIKLEPRSRIGLSLRISSQRANKSVHSVGTLIKSNLRESEPTFQSGYSTLRYTEINTRTLGDWLNLEAWLRSFQR